MSTTITVSTVSKSSSNDTQECFAGASFVYTLVRSLGLCVEVTDHLARVLRTNAIVQAAVSLPGILGAALALRVTSLRKNRSSLSVQVSPDSNSVFIWSLWLASL